MVQIQQIVCGPLHVNCYVFHADGAKSCIAIDAADAAPVQAFAAEHGLTISHVLLTHGHFDHIGGAAALQRAGARVCIHEADSAMLENGQSNLASIALRHTEPCQADMLLEDGQVLQMEGFALQILHTPGHTPGGVCYLMEQENTLFSGDTLFRLSVGRSDFPGGDHVQLYRAIREKLLVLPADTAVRPGHMEGTTIRYEQKYNPFLKDNPNQQW